MSKLQTLRITPLDGAGRFTVTLDGQEIRHCQKLEIEMNALRVPVVTMTMVAAVDFTGDVETGIVYTGDETTDS